MSLLQDNAFLSIKKPCNISIDIIKKKELYNKCAG